MNSKLFYAISAELGQAQEELRVANENWKKDKSLPNTIAKDLAQTKFDQWQKAMNLLYIKG